MADEKKVTEEVTELEKSSNKKDEIIRVLKFVAFSASAGVIETVTITLLYDVFHVWTYSTCYLIGLVLSVLWNFTLNRKFTFKSANNVPLAMFKVFCYYCVFTPATLTLGGWLTDGAILEHSVFDNPVGLPGIVSTIVIMALNLSTEFLYQRFFVFKDSINTNDVAEKDAAKKAAKAEKED